LPAYIRYFLGARASKERAISLSFLATSGFVFALAAFTVAFLVLRGLFSSPFQTPKVPFGPSRAPIGTFVILLPFVFDVLGYIAGAIAIVMGVLMLRRVEIPFFRARSLGKFNRSVRSVVLFSLGWGLASIACSPYAIFPFLFFALAKGGVMPFLGFALGMAIPVLSVSLLLGFGKGPFVEKIVRASAKIHRASGVLLIATGFVVVIYTFFNPATTGYYLFG
jgi:cytochrome c biogenesis protein CcdA